MQARDIESAIGRPHVASEGNAKQTNDIDELIRSVNEVADQVRDTLNLVFFDIG